MIGGMWRNIGRHSGISLIPWLESTCWNTIGMSHARSAGRRRAKVHAETRVAAKHTHACAKALVRGFCPSPIPWPTLNMAAALLRESEVVAPQRLRAMEGQHVCCTQDCRLLPPPAACADAGSASLLVTPPAVCRRPCCRRRPRLAETEGMVTIGGASALHTACRLSGARELELPALCAKGQGPGPPMGWCGSRHGSAPLVEGNRLSTLAQLKVFHTTSDM